MVAAAVDDPCGVVELLSACYSTEEV